jgi:hypothetical protein
MHNLYHTMIQRNRKTTYGKQCCGSESGSTGSTCFWASRIRIRIHLSEVWIRILQSSCKNSKKNFDSSYFVTLFEFLTLKNDENGASKSHKPKKLCKKISFLLASWRSKTKTEGSRSGSISQRHGSADPDPDPPQNVMDPQHWWKGMEVATIFAGLFDGGKGGGVWILFQRQQKMCFSFLFVFLACRFK